MAGLGLGLRRYRDLVLPAVAGDVIDLDLDLLLLGPFIDEICAGLVGIGNPVVPHAYRQRPGGVGATHIGCGDEGCG